MATSGLDTQLKIWDIRTYKQLQAYRMVRPASTLAISQRGLLATGCGPHVQVGTSSKLKYLIRYINFISHHEFTLDMERCLSYKTKCSLYEQFVSWLCCS
jgi:U3 small nucleolar RNA-associated protein 7